MDVLSHGFGYRFLALCGRYNLVRGRRTGFYHSMKDRVMMWMSLSGLVGSIFVG